MTKIITTGNMRHVDIQKGWLIRQFTHYVLGIGGGVNTLLRDLEISGTKPWDAYIVRLNAEFADALERWDELVYQKNVQYEDAWQIDGPVTALTDLKDKLYRLSTATRTQAAISWDPDKRRSILFDIIVRAMMVLAWDGANFKDDDDDRETSNGQV
jgi:hypothetical protein